MYKNYPHSVANSYRADHNLPPSFPVSYLRRLNINIWIWKNSESQYGAEEYTQRRGLILTLTYSIMIIDITIFAPLFRPYGDWLPWFLEKKWLSYDCPSKTIPFAVWHLSWFVDWCRWWFYTVVHTKARVWSLVVIPVQDIIPTRNQIYSKWYTSLKPSSAMQNLNQINFHINNVEGFIAKQFTRKKRVWNAIADITWK